jgi:hypothetical protein
MAKMIRDVCCNCTERRVEIVVHWASNFRLIQAEKPIVRINRFVSNSESRFSGCLNYPASNPGSRIVCDSRYEGFPSLF